MGLSVMSSNAGGPDDMGEDGLEEAQIGKVAGEPRVEDIFVSKEEVMWYK